ncbi:L-amino-acid oxidase-like isoform X2 [Mercenaria mercenaria]|uniref:L-amino-acid oxidase-like isoform X2 n=2 Tax=Mercenaria mercenaria TaxID=6596 RepID=UPI00234F5F26|nr:L-amino-acid oxidase-like isoform X2 [Mercenaria mercenaria]
MRLPSNHYLTWHYLNLFDIETVPFQNYNGKGYLYLYGEKIRLDDWKNNNKKYCDKFWPGWDKNLTDEDKEKYKIDGILTYYTATMRPVMDELGTCPTEKTWHDWLCKWSKISGEDFLRGCCVDKKGYPLTAWPEPAIEGLMESTFIPTLKRNLATHLRGNLDTLQKEPMKTPKFGMDTLPKAFAKKNEKGWNIDVDLSKNIKFGIMVTAVENFETMKKRKKVKVTGINRTTGQMEVTEADAVILTLPLHILRQLDIPFSKEQQNALSHIHCVAYTKIMLQCKTRFWQKDVGQGGFSKMTTGQLRYPDYESSGIDDDERGILSLFTTAESALTYGSQSKEMAILSAVRDISKIHPEIKSEFEVGTVQAWHSDPVAQGAFAFLKPHEFINHMNLLTKPTETIYLAGDALSWAHTWIQGAIFSGLMQAYCFQSHLEDKCICEPVSLMLD